MKEIRKKLLVICPYPENVAPSQRLKFEQYYPYFRQAGFDVEIRPFISIPFWNIIYEKGFFFKKMVYTLSGYSRRIIDLFKALRADVVYIHLWTTPFGPPLFEWLFFKLSRKIVYDIDDLVYLKNVESKAHAIVTLIKGHQKPIFLMKNADHVITCTPYLDKFVKQFNENTTDISSTVDTIFRYKPTFNYKSKELPVIGWSGSHSTSKYLYLLQPVFRKLAENFKFKILVLGDNSVWMEGVDIDAKSWSEDIEINTIKQFDIGVYPLPDEEWVYGKSGLKAIQYMALGIPTVATAIGTNFRVIDDNLNGFLVNSEQEWIDKLSLLLSDMHLREKIGKAGRQKIENEFSIAKNVEKYLNVLHS